MRTPFCRSAGAPTLFPGKYFVGVVYLITDGSTVPVFGEVPLNL